MRLRIQLILLILLTAAVCASCAFDYSRQMDTLMNSKFIEEQFGATIPDLAAGARCPNTQEVSVYVIEDRKGRRTLSTWPDIYVQYEEFAASVQRYFVDTLGQAKIRVLPSGGKVIQVRVEDASLSTGWGPSFGKTTLAITVPDWNLSDTYTGEGTSGVIYRAIPYSVYEAVLAFLKDPQVQRQLRCTE